MANLAGAFVIGKPLGPLPEGDYHGKIVAAKKKTSKSGNEYLNVTFVVTDGVREVKVWEVLNLWNSNEKAAEMARVTLTAITDATFGKGHRINDSDELIGKQMGVRAEIDESPGYAAKNKLTGFWALTPNVLANLKAQKERIIAEKAAAEKAAAPAAEEVFSDDVPF